MRLGAYPCLLSAGSRAARAYGKQAQCRMLNAECRMAGKSSGKAFSIKHSELCISERHRHRYELAMDSEARRAMEAAGLRVSGVSPDGSLAEVVELPGHPYFIAGQFHPEFKSRPAAPHPLFLGLVTAALARKPGRRHGQNLTRPPPQVRCPLQSPPQPLPPGQARSPNRVPPP